MNKQPIEIKVSLKEDKYYEKLINSLYEIKANQAVIKKKANKYNLLLLLTVIFSLTNLVLELIK